MLSQLDYFTVVVNCNMISQLNIYLILTRRNFLILSSQLFLLSWKWFLHVPHTHYTWVEKCVCVWERERERTGACVHESESHRCIGCLLALGLYYLHNLADWLVSGDAFQTSDQYFNADASCWNVRHTLTCTYRQHYRFLVRLQL